MFRMMTILQRSIVGFGLVCALFAGLGALSMARMSDIRERAIDMESVWMPAVERLAALNLHLQRTRTMMLGLLINRDDPVQAQDFRKTLSHMEAMIPELEDSYIKNAEVDPSSLVFSNYVASRVRFYEILAHLLELERNGQLSDARKLLASEMDTIAHELDKNLKSLGALTTTGARSAVQDAAVIYKWSQRTTIAAIIVVTLVTMFYAWAFTRSIDRPLRMAIAVADSVAAGDLTLDFHANGRDELTRLISALKEMITKLHNTLLTINQGADGLAVASGQLHRSSHEADGVAQQQTVEINQAALAVSKMLEVVESVALNAVTTAERSREADDYARSGMELVKISTQAILELEESMTVVGEQVEGLAVRSHAIGKIVDVIRGIAEQTNLLALNAAIEASRAGGAGRGFAVVADEVRALAHRTQKATSEIDQMIRETQQESSLAVSAMRESRIQLSDALQLKQELGNALGEICESISKISERNLLIAGAAKDQAQAVRVVDQNLSTVLALSTNASLGARQVALACAQLAHLSNELKNVISRFRTRA